MVTATEMHENYIRQFSSVASRWSINALLRMRNKNYMPLFMEPWITNSRSSFEGFRTELKTELSKTDNWQAIEIDIKSRFLKEIETYLLWYEKNKEATKAAEPFNFYEIMFEIMISTRNEIAKYFPIYSNGIESNRLDKTEQTDQDNEKALQEPECEPKNNNFVEAFETWLSPLKEDGSIAETDYKILTESLSKYFNTGHFPKLKGKIKFNKVAVKRVGWALNRIYRNVNNNNEDLSLEYLLFAKENISIFTKTAFDKKSIHKSNLYKYFTTRPKNS